MSSQYQYPLENSVIQYFSDIVITPRKLVMVPQKRTTKPKSAKKNNPYQTSCSVCCKCYSIEKHGDWFIKECINGISKNFCDKCFI